MRTNMWEKTKENNKIYMTLFWTELLTWLDFQNMKQRIQIEIGVKDKKVTLKIITLMVTKLELFHFGSGRRSELLIPYWNRTSKLCQSRIHSSNFMGLLSGMEALLKMCVFTLLNMSNNWRNHKEYFLLMHQSLASHLWYLLPADATNRGCPISRFCAVLGTIPV